MALSKPTAAITEEVFIQAFTRTLSVSSSTDLIVIVKYQLCHLRDTSAVRFLFPVAHEEHRSATLLDATNWGQRDDFSSASLYHRRSARDEAIKTSLQQHRRSKDSQTASQIASQTASRTTSRTASRISLHTSSRTTSTTASHTASHTTSRTTSDTTSYVTYDITYEFSNDVTNDVTYGMTDGVPKREKTMPYSL